MYMRLLILIKNFKLKKYFKYNNNNNDKKYNTIALIKNNNKNPVKFINHNKQL